MPPGSKAVPRFFLVGAKMPGGIMGKVISVTNMKGGVGKTTLTANLGDCLAREHKKKVLLIDIDPQFNLTQYCMSEEDYEKIQESETSGTIYNIFFPDTQAVPSFLKDKTKKQDKSRKIIHKLRDRLDLVPASINLIDFIDQRRSGTERLLNDFVSKVKDSYDFILIDCPPTSTILSRAAYLSSEFYVIPMGMDYFSVMGIPLLQKDIFDYMNTYGSKMKGVGIIRTKFLEWTRVARKHKDIIELFSEKTGVPLFDASLKQRQEVQNALSERKFILEFSPTSESAKDIKAITTEFLKKVEEVEDES